MSRCFCIKDLTTEQCPQSEASVFIFGFQQKAKKKWNIIFFSFLSITIGYICIIKQIECLVIKICEILWFDMSSYCRLGDLDDAYLSKKE